MLAEPPEFYLIFVKHKNICCSNVNLSSIIIPKYLILFAYSNRTTLKIISRGIGCFLGVNRINFLYSHVLGSDHHSHLPSMIKIEPVARI